jgi:predicted RNA-binding protein
VGPWVIIDRIRRGKFPEGAALAHFASPYWLFFTAFVGLNLFQSGFTNWCPMMWILKKAGLQSAGSGS